MNERIRELIVQSGNGQFHNGKCYPHIGSRTLEDWTKFAELIVQECIKCCDEIDDINKTYREVRLVDPEFGPKECIRMIKKHFGVES